MPVDLSLQMIGHQVGRVNSAKVLLKLVQSNPESVFKELRGY